jgi:hypothetical protein
MVTTALASSCPAIRGNWHATNVYAIITWRLLKCTLPCFEYGMSTHKHTTEPRKTQKKRVHGSTPWSLKEYNFRLGQVKLYWHATNVYSIIIWRLLKCTLLCFEYGRHTSTQLSQRRPKKNCEILSMKFLCQAGQPNCHWYVIITNNTVLHQ